MKKWVCSICGYVFEGENPPEQCPICKASADKFKEKKDDQTLAAEHVYGVYDKLVKDNADVPEADKQYIL